MKIRTIVNDLTIDGTEYPKGATVPDIDDKVGKGLVARGLASEIQERKPAPKPEIAKERSRK